MKTKPQIETRQRLAKRELALAKRLTPAQKTRVRKKMRREYGPSYFAEKMSGLAAAAKQIAKEGKTMAAQPMTEKIQ